MLRLKKLREIDFFSRSLILFSFLLNLSVAIVACYFLAWIYIQRGFVDGDIYQANITEFYLLNYPQDLYRLIELSRHLEESVNMSHHHIRSFVQDVSFRWNDSLNCYRANICVTVVHIFSFLVSLMSVNRHRRSSSGYYSTAIMYVGEMVLDCMQADSNVKVILRINEYFNALNWCRVTKNASTSAAVHFLAVHPPGFYFAVIILRMALKAIFYGVLVEQADKSDNTETDH